MAGNTFVHLLRTFLFIYVRSRENHNNTYTHSGRRINFATGFTILELIVVIAGLGILASLAIPNFLKYLEFAQIDEAKSLLNAAAAECLQKNRQSPSGVYSWENTKPEALNARKSSMEGGKPSLPGAYQYLDDKDSCKEVMIADPSGGDTIFPTLRFRIDRSGKVFKDSQYFNDESKQACETWGNCGGSESADYLIECKAQQTECDLAYNNFAKTQSNGGPKQVGKWRGACKWPRDPEAGCTLTQVWTFDGKIISSQSDYDSLFAAKLGAECAKSKKDQIAKFSPPGEGIVNLPECNIYERYFSGIQLNCTDGNSCQTAYLAASQEQRQKQCAAEREKWITAGKDGSFEPNGVQGCDKEWMCTGRPVSKSEYDSTCAAPPPPPAKVCRKPDNKYCERFKTLQVCQPICN